MLLLRCFVGRAARRDDFLGHDRPFLVLRAGEDSGQAVVILHRDRVVFVIVAAGAGDGQAQDAAGQRIDSVVPFVGGRLGLLDVLRVVDRTECEQTERRHPFVLCRIVEQIARNLSRDEFVVERFDNPVAVVVAARVSAGLERVSLVFAVTGYVQPVPAPSFAVLGRIQQPVHDRGEGIRRRVVQKGFNLLRSRRQSDEIEIDATQQRVPGRSGVRLQPGLMEPCPNEAVDVVVDSFVVDLRRLVLLRGLESPELQSCLVINR